MFDLNEVGGQPLSLYLFSYKNIHIYTYICYIPGWWFQSFCIFHSIWDNPAHWLIFFKMVKTTNQIQSPSVPVFSVSLVFLFSPVSASEAGQLCTDEHPRSRALDDLKPWWWAGGGKNMGNQLGICESLWSTLTKNYGKSSFLMGKLWKKHHF